MDNRRSFRFRMVNLNQIGALLWKDYLVRIRQPWMTTIQFLWPALLFLSLYALRLRFSSREIDACQFPTRQLPSRADVLPFFQSYICTIDNQCMRPDQYEETAAFANAPVTPILNIVQTFLNEPALLNTVNGLPESGNFFGAVTTVAMNPRFGYIQEQINTIRARMPEYERKVGGDFDIEKLWSDGDTFATFGNILCDKPFPRSDNIRFVERAFEHEDYNGPDKEELDAMPTKYCKQLYLDVTSTNHGKITWSQIKPIIQGRILYGPDTEHTRKIVSYANGTFEGISNLKTFLGSLVTVVTKLRNDTEYRNKLGSLVDLIKTPAIQAIIGSVNVDPTMIDGILDSLLHDPALLSVLQTVSGIMDCFNVDRFLPVADNAELERTALQMNQKKLFYAAVLFDGVGNWTEDRTVSYTLRMDVDNTPKTIENRNRFWFPGPEASFTDDMRYHRGFIEWQHAIDSGIIKMFKSDKLAKDKGVVSGEASDEELSFGDDFFNENVKDADFGPPRTTTIELESQSNSSEEVSSATLSPDVESFLDFDDETSTTTRKTISEQPPIRRKRQFEGLFAGIFGGDGSAEASAPDTFLVDEMKVYTKMFPYPRYVHDEFKKGLYLANAVQVAFFFALLVQIAAAVRQRLWTGESGNRKLMQCMGLWRSSDLIAWSLTTYLEIVLTFLVCSVILYSGGVLASTSVLFLIFFLGLFAVSVLSFCYMTSAFFTKATIGSVSSAIIFLMTFMPYIVIVSVGSTLTPLTKIVMNLSVSTAFCFAWNHITRLELQQHDVSFGEAFTGSPSSNDLLFGMMMLCIDTALYTAIGYLYGRFVAATDEEHHHFVEVAVRDMPADVGAQLRDVTKSYGVAGRPALQKVSIEFRRDRITCLLGRNGAGKSTIIKLLTGQIEATSGQVFLQQNLNALTGDERKERVGLCPQSTVLIPNLTAKEHLQMYASIKLDGNGSSGLDKAVERNCEVERVMAGLEFGEYERFRCENLSGGFKRRLNIGIAFIGSPNLVILDEPCSAVDTKARRSIWQTIKVLRKGRAVIMATHHLDEAELLSDSVVILNEGRLIAENTTQSLRDQFQKSLCVRVELPGHENGIIRNSDGVVGVLRQILGQFGPEHSLRFAEPGVVDVTIARYNAAGEYLNLKPLIKALERLRHNGQIVGFKVTSNNLEEMFNRLVAAKASGTAANGNSENGTAHKEQHPIELGGGEKPKSPTPQPEVSQWQLFVTLLWKRFVHFRRNYRLILCVLVLPTVFVAIAMGFMTIRPPGEFDVALNISRQLYATSREFYTLQKPSSDFDETIYAQLEQHWDEDSVEFADSAEAFRWLINCSEEGATNRYGGISLNGSVAAVWYNNKGYHSMPVYLNELNNAMLNAEMRGRNGSGEEEWGDEYRIRTVNRPLKLGMDELSASSVLQKVADAGISIILLVAFSLVIAGSSVYIVNERLTGEKLQQKLAGVGFPMYWGVAVVWDMAVYCVAIVLAVAVILAFDIPAYTARDNLAGIVIMLFMFGFASTPMVHLCEKLFADASLANMHILCMNIILALTTRTTIMLIDLLGDSDTSAWIRDNLNRAFFIFPQHALADGLVELCENHILAVVFARYYISTYKSPLTSNLLVPHIFSLFCAGCLFAGLNFIIESGLYHRWQQRRQAGRDLASLDPMHKSGAILKLPATDFLAPQDADANCVVAVQGVGKRYGEHQALDDVSFRVRKAECFGLLGANGAGKSTVFAILSGQTYATAGTVRWFGGGEHKQRQPNISYCPQTNALNDLLTVAETIRFYGVLRRVTDLEQLTAHALHQFHLQPYRNVLVKDLSGGNRRKLSVACTCFGRTPLVLMDEPTSDMDPVTRHLTYACIRQLLAAGRSVILTSHTIAEIDGVCDRIAILRRGRLVSMGSTEALQRTYGLCYAVTVWHSAATEAAGLSGPEPVTSAMMEQELRDRVPGMEAVQVAQNGCGGVQFVVRIRGGDAGGHDDDDGEAEAVAGGRVEPDVQSHEATLLRLSDLCEVIHQMAMECPGLQYTLAECLLDQAFERVLETNQSNYTYANSAFLLNESV